MITEMDFVRSINVEPCSCFDSVALRGVVAERYRLNPTWCLTLSANLSLFPDLEVGLDLDMDLDILAFDPF